MNERKGWFQCGAQLNQRLVVACISAEVLTAFTALVQSPLLTLPQLSQSTQTDPVLGLDFLLPQSCLVLFEIQS